jgi:hypothetical protein
VLVEIEAASYEAQQLCLDAPPSPAPSQLLEDNVYGRREDTYIV